MDGSGRTRTGLRCVGTSVLRIEKSKGNPGGGSRRNRLMAGWLAAGCCSTRTFLRSLVLSFLSLFLWYNSLHSILQSLPRLLYLNLPRCCFPRNTVALGVVGPPLQSGVRLLLRYVCTNSANRNQRRFEAAHQVTSILISLPPSFAFVLLSRGITTPTAVRPPAGVEESAAAEGSVDGWTDGWMVGVAPPRASLPLPLPRCLLPSSRAARRSRSRFSLWV